MTPALGRQDGVQSLESGKNSVFIPHPLNTALIA